jgi:hypothetical protein
MNFFITANDCKLVVKVTSSPEHTEDKRRLYSTDQLDL